MENLVMEGILLWACNDESEKHTREVKVCESDGWTDHSKTRVLYFR